MKKQLLLTSAFLLTIPFVNGLGGKAHAQGTFAWAKQIGGTDYESAYDIKTDAAGNVYTLGTFYNAVDFDPGPGVFVMTSHEGMWGYNQDFFISKLDASGNFVWAKQFGGTDGYYSAGGMAVDAEGNVFLTGSFEGTIDMDPDSTVEYNLTTLGSYDEEIFVTKLDVAGHFAWAKRFGALSADDYYSGYSNGIALDASNNVYTVGNFQGTFDFDPGPGLDTISSYMAEWGSNADIFINKLTTSGELVWTKRYGSTTDYDYAMGIAVDKAGDAFTTGTFYNPMDFDPGDGVFTMTPSMGSYGYYNSNVFISKLDAAGNFGWAKKFGGEDYCNVNGIAADTAGNVYTVGTYEGTTDFNPGTGTYNLTPIMSEYGYGQDIFVSKLDNTGNFGWARSIGGSGTSEYPYAITADAASNVYFTGSFQDSADFNPRSPVYNLISVGMYSQSIFVAKLDDAGSFLWAKRIGGSEDYEYGNEGNAIAVDATANTYVAGSFEYTVDFDPGVGVYELSPTPGMWWTPPDVFILKLHDTLSTVNVAEQLGHGLNSFMVYPNPNSGEFNLGMNLEADSKLAIEIYDITGQLIKTVNQSKLSAGISTLAIDGSELSNGIYFVKIYNETINKTLKFTINK